MGKYFKLNLQTSKVKPTKNLVLNTTTKLCNKISHIKIEINIVPIYNS